MKVITLRQPWATLMAYCLKTIETRSWPTKYRGPLAIHAAKKSIKLSEYDPCYLALQLSGLEYKGLPEGAILSICELIDCKEITPNNVPGFPECDLGDYTPGRFMWITRPIRIFKEPIPTRGYQRLWNISDELIRDEPVNDRD